MSCQSKNYLKSTAYDNDGVDDLPSTFDGIKESYRKNTILLASDALQEEAVFFILLLFLFPHAIFFTSFILNFSLRYFHKIFS